MYIIATGAYRKSSSMRSERSVMSDALDIQRANVWRAFAHSQGSSFLFSSSKERAYFH